MYLVVLSYPKPTQIKIKSSFFPSFVALSSGTAASEHVKTLTAPLESVDLSWQFGSTSANE